MAKLDAHRPDQPDVGSRSGVGGGQVIVATRVIEKTAAQAAAELPAVAGQGRGFLGFGAHADASARPKVTAQVSGDTAALSVQLALGFPTRIDRTIRSVQQELATQVTRLTGITVSRVDVDVVGLLVTDRAARGPRSPRTVR